MNKIQIFVYLWLACISGSIAASCPEVDGLNSPISIFHEHIETLYKQLSVSSTDDIIKLIYFSQKDIVHLHSYVMIFSRKNNASGNENYIGIATQPKDETLSSLAIPHSIVKYIESDNINEVKTVLGVRDDQPNEYQCDDFKGKFGTFLTQRGQFSFSSIWQNQASWVRQDTANALENNKAAVTQNAVNSLKAVRDTTITRENTKAPSTDSTSRASTGTTTIPSSSTTSANQTINNNGSSTGNTSTSNSNPPILININNQIGGSPSTMATSTGNLPSATSVITTNRSATNSSTQTSTTAPPTSSTTTSKNDDDLNFNYNFVNNWYDSFVSSLPNNIESKETVSATANSNASVSVSGKQSSTSANSNASASVNSGSKANSSNRIVVTPSSSPSDTRISQTQNTEVNTSNIVNNNYGSQNLSLFNTMRTYKDIPDQKNDRRQVRDERNVGIDTLVEKGMTYEQILAILRKNKQSDEIQKQLEKKKQEEEDQKKRNALFLRAKEEQELIQKLYLILAYRKRQEDAQATASAKVRPTEYLYNNLYGNNTKLPTTLGQQTLYTIVPDGLGLNTSELSSYLNLSSSDLAKIITQKEQQYGNTLGGGKREVQEWSSSKGSYSFGGGNMSGKDSTIKRGNSILDEQTIAMTNAYGLASFRQ